MTTEKDSRRAAVGASLLLIFLATVIAEVLIGSTPFSRFGTLPFQFLYYGLAALVSREVVVRLRLRRAALVVLGVAFGICTEGLALQSIFNPHFLNLDISFGRLAGVNWPWALYMVAYHALWSITIPVTLTGLAFRNQRSVPWVNRWVTVVFLVLFVLVGLAIHSFFRQQFHFVAPLAPNLVALALVLVLIVVALRLKRPAAPVDTVGPRPAWVAGLTMFVFGGVWFLLYAGIFGSEHRIPAWLNLVLGVVAALAMIFLSRRLFPAAWSDAHAFAFIAGGLAANSLFGIYVVSVSGVAIDLYAHIVIVVGATALLALLWKKRVASRRIT